MEDRLRVRDTGQQYPGECTVTSTVHSPPILTLRGVEFSYSEGTPVLGGISLTVARGEIVGIIGPSGSGKSTLLSLIATLVKPTVGTIERHLGSTERHPLSMVFQGDTLLPWLSLRDNVRFFSRFGVHEMKRSVFRWTDRQHAVERTRELDGRVDELLERVGLLDRADYYPYQLSGGMRRRLAFLSAVAANPQILLLDEPFSSVDEPTRIGIHEDVFRIARMMQMTTLLVTHDLAEAITLCDRVIILTNRPATIALERLVPFGDERNMLDLRDTDAYLELYGGLWHELKAQIAEKSNGASPGRARDGR